MNKVKFWLNNARALALPQSITPAITAAVMCIGAPSFSWWLALLAVVGVALAHLSCNLFDDYFDYKNAGLQSRQRLVRAGMRAHMGKCEYLAQGLATLSQTRNVAALMGLIAVIIGVIVASMRGVSVLYIALAGGLMGFFYSAKPFCLGYHGLGELITGLIFGPLLMMGISVASCGVIDSSVVYMSIAVGLLVVNILYSHSMMDLDADKSVGKTTLAVALKKSWVVFFAFIFFNFGAYAIIMIGVLLGNLSQVYLLVLLVLPRSIIMCKAMWQFEHGEREKMQRNRWMGSMANWEAIQKAGFDWFMLRWYLSRNITSQFCSIVAIVAIVCHFIS